MKRILIIFITITVAGCYGKKPEIKKTGLEGQLMPKIDLISVDSFSHINTENIAQDKPTILFAFEPWCPYCRAQTSAIISNIESLQGINIYMICKSNYQQFKIFYNKYKLQNYPNIKAGIDYKYSFARYFKTNAIPVLAIYNKDKKLQQVIQGKTYISHIKSIALN